MAHIKIPKIWEIQNSHATPENVYLNRRTFLKKLGKVGIGTLGLYAASIGFGLPKAWAQSQKNTNQSHHKPTPTKESQLTPSPESLTTRYNNYYEFGTNSANIWRLTDALPQDEWTIKVSGLVEKSKTLNLERLIQAQSLEERIYKLRCVETWTVTIPWTGFPLRRLIKAAAPLSSANYMVIRTFLNPNIANGQKERFWEPWPYVEGLRMDEAMHDLTFLATGMYGKPLTPQNGAPIRLAVPWKYGFKSIKAIAEIEFTREAPKTFWQQMAPLEYDFWANVDPKTPYARWDQSVEHVLGEERIEPTRPFNGFAEQVAQLYV